MSTDILITFLQLYTQVFVGKIWSVWLRRNGGIGSAISISFWKLIASYFINISMYSHGGTYFIAAFYLCL